MLNYCKQLLQLGKCFTYSIHYLVSVHFMNKSTKGLKQNIKYKPSPVHAAFCDSPKIESFFLCPACLYSVCVCVYIYIYI